MKITVKDNEYELDLGIGFALNLDSKYKFKQKVAQDPDVEFGLGVPLLYGQLTAVSIQGIVDFSNAGFTAVPKKQLPHKEHQKAVEALAMEKGGFKPLAHECIEELKNVGLYQHIFEDPEDLTKTAYAKRLAEQRLRIAR